MEHFFQEDNIYVLYVAVGIRDTDALRSIAEESGQAELYPDQAFIQDFTAGRGRTG